MAKMCIHIPDDTLLKLKQYKGSMNISKVCSAALLREVDTISNVPPMVEDTKRLIERLRSESKKENIESFSLGVKLAQAYLSRVSKDQLNYWGSVVLNNKSKIVLPEEVEDYIDRCSMEKKLRNFNRAGFTHGWLTVMKRTWETVHNRI